VLFHRRRHVESTTLEEPIVITAEVGTGPLPGLDPVDVDPASPEVQAALDRLALVPSGLLTESLTRGMLEAAEAEVFHRELREQEARAREDLEAAKARQDVTASLAAQSALDTARNLASNLPPVTVDPTAFEESFEIAAAWVTKARQINLTPPPLTYVLEKAAFRSLAASVPRFAEEVDPPLCTPETRALVEEVGVLERALAVGSDWQSMRSRGPDPIELLRSAEAVVERFRQHADQSQALTARILAKNAARIESGSSWEQPRKFGAHSSTAVVALQRHRQAAALASQPVAVG
jgi:hypothetical protein